LANELAENLTVYNFDRRGRGGSGDTKPYSVEREVEDVAALVVEAGQPVFVYGHSAGSALPCAPARQAEEAAKMQAFHDRGDHRAAAAFFLSGFGPPSEAVEEMLESPAGEGMIDCARALPHDYAMVGDGLGPNARLQVMKASVHELAPTPKVVTLFFS
jgi:pimeloyl-ACP methyl ester carboxylesterase